LTALAAADCACFELSESKSRKFASIADHTANCPAGVAWSIVNTRMPTL
jgi:hypothetical protein